MLETYTAGLAMALGNRSDQLQAALDEQLQRLDNSFGDRTENLQAVFEEYARALDAALANRAEALDNQLIERTKSLDEAFAERLRLFDDSIMRSTAAIDSAVVEKTQSLTDALDAHALHFSGTIGRQATDLDEALMQGISSVRRASENITRQSIKAMEGLANQSDQLRNLSDTLLGQISSVTGRFENQGQVIVEAANTLESLNYQDRRDAADPPCRLEPHARAAVRQGRRVRPVRRRLLHIARRLDLRRRPAGTPRAAADARAGRRRERAHASRICATAFRPSRAR